MKILSIQVGLPREVEWQGKPVRTGIFKTPISGPVFVRQHQIDGDGQADPSVHGGVDKAVYAYGGDAYAWWNHQLQQKLPWGAFGENLTITSLDEREIFVGDRYRLGDSELEVSEPRFPCFKLGIKFQDMGILKTFLESGRPGIYFRVLREGKIAVGDHLERIAPDPARASIYDFYTTYNHKVKNHDFLDRVLHARNLSPKWRERFQKLKEN